MSHDPPHIVCLAPGTTEARARLLRALLPGDPDRARRLHQGLDARPGGWDHSVLAKAGPTDHLGAAIILDRPGGSGTLLPPQVGGHEARVAAGACAIRHAIGHYRDAVPDGVVITMTASSDRETNRVLTLGGMSVLTTLRFLRARVESPRTPARCPAGYRVDSLANQPDAIAEALRASCEHSQDCPELGARRRPERVLEGHLNGDSSIPPHWLGAYVGEGETTRLVGLSLTRPRTDAEAGGGDWDLIYIGIAPEARQAGVGRFLLDQQFRRLEAAGATSLSLACDTRNTPALTLYSSVGFSQTGERLAWLDAPHS